MRLTHAGPKGCRTTAVALAVLVVFAPAPGLAAEQPQAPPPVASVDVGGTVSAEASLLASASVEVQQLAATSLEPYARAARRSSSSKSPAYSWNHRHHVLFGALTGAAGGCAIAAAGLGAEGAWVGTFGGAAAGAIVAVIDLPRSSVRGIRLQADSTARQIRLKPDPTTACR
jgi:hypothetical protein